MRRAVKVKAYASPVLESEILKGVIGLSGINLELWLNTRGKYQHHESGRWITYGLGPNGASDAIGYRVIRITPDMVGKRVAQFCAIETKARNEVCRKDQEAFIDNINAAGGLAGMVRSVEEAARLLGLMR